MTDMITEAMFKHGAKQLDQQAQFLRWAGEILIIGSSVAVFFNIIGLGLTVGLIGIGLSCVIESARASLAGLVVRLTHLIEVRFEESRSGASCSRGQNWVPVSEETSQVDSACVGKHSRPNHSCDWGSAALQLVHL
jgi:hypothetical protein